MPYITGVANSFADLRTALISGLTANGWTLTGNIVHKGALYLTVTANETFVSTTVTEGLIFQGGTGDNAGSLVAPSAVTPRLGRSRPEDPVFSWPAEYHLHINSSPDEVFLVVRYNVDFYTWAAFGQSQVQNLNGSGMWVTAQNGLQQNRYESVNLLIGWYNLTPTEGGTQYQSSFFYYEASGAPFWNTGWTTYYSGPSHHQVVQDTIHANLMAYPQGWMGYYPPNQPGSQIIGVRPAAPHIARLPSAWSQEAVLVPIQVYAWVAESKCSLVLEVANARYTRIDNYEPGQVIQIGPDRWKIYPFVRKNMLFRDAGSGVNETTGQHSGTLGWAIRYDGA